MNHLRLVLITFFCAWTYSSSAMSINTLPLINLFGLVNGSGPINVKLSLESTNQFDPACYTITYRSGQSYKNAHTYTLKADGFSDFYGSYYIDMDADGRFLSFLRSQIGAGKLDLRIGMSILDYRQLCQFKLKALQFNANDTLVILKDREYSFFQSVFDVALGTTVSFPFDFHNQSRVRLEVNVFKGFL